MTNEFQEIIGIMFADKIIYFGQHAIDHLNLIGSYVRLVSRAEFRLMGALDLGQKFTDWANDLPTLITLPEGTSREIRGF